MIGISVRSKYGPAIEREPRGLRYHCLAYPCPNSTRLFYRPRNSHLCVDCIRKRMPRHPATPALSGELAHYGEHRNEHKDLGSALPSMGEERGVSADGLGVHVLFCHLQLSAVALPPRFVRPQHVSNSYKLPSTR